MRYICTPVHTFIRAAKLFIHKFRQSVFLFIQTNSVVAGIVLFCRHNANALLRPTPTHRNSCICGCRLCVRFYYILNLPSSFCSVICCKHAARRYATVGDQTQLTLCCWLLLAVRFISSSVDNGKRTRLDVPRRQP